MRDPWLAGSLPDDAERTRLAEDVDSSLANADDAADNAADLLGARAASAALREERERHVADRKLERDQSASVHGESLRSWHALLTGVGLPAVLDPPAWRARRDALEKTAEARSATSRTTTGRSRRQRRCRRPLLPMSTPSLRSSDSPGANRCRCATKPQHDSPTPAPTS